MTTTMDSLYISLLGAPDPSFELQERAFKYAKGRKGSRIPLALIRLENLSDEIDEKLGQDPPANVLAAWIARKPRSFETLANIVTRTKSQKVLQVLSEQEALDAETYAKIAAKADPGSAIGLYHNAKVPKDVKLQLGPGLAKVWISTHSKELSGILDQTPELFEGIFKSPLISTRAWRAIANMGYIPSKFHTLLIARLRQEVEAGNLQQDFALERFGQASYLDMDSLKELRSIFGIVNSYGYTAATQYAIDRVEYLISDGKNGNDISSKLRRADTQAVFDSTMSKLVSLDRDAANSAVTSPFFNLKNAQHLKKLWRWGPPDTLFESARTNPDALFILIVTFPRENRLELISKTQDPSALISRLVNHFKDLPDCDVRWFFDSLYFDQSLVTALSPGFFASQAMPGNAVKTLDTILFKTFGDNESAWDTFESLIASHEGSIGDLIAIVSALCDLPDEDAKPELEAKESAVKSAKIPRTAPEAILGDPLFEL